MNFCYRHPDREAYVRCQRCERFICPACQNEAAVGFLCPEDAGRSPVADTVTRLMPRRARTLVNSGSPVATMTIIGICVVVFGLQRVNSSITDSFAYTPVATMYEPWRMLTSVFLHSTRDIMHIVLNMWSLWAIGRAVEYAIGISRFIWLFLLSGFGGSVAVLLLASPNTWVLGASGAIFGLLGAYFVILRSLGTNGGQLGAVVAVNLVAGFVLPGIAWQAHVGGLVVGAAVGFIYSKTRAASARGQQAIYLIVVAFVLVALTFVGVQKIIYGY